MLESNSPHNMYSYPWINIDWAALILNALWLILFTLVATNNVNVVNSNDGDCSEKISITHLAI